MNAVCKRRRLKQANLEHRQHKSANDIGKLERSNKQTAKRTIFIRVTFSFPVSHLSSHRGSA
uniref:Uncharacterized protein n=1 Tax=Anopheles quadriannulatus TaxID=34691 RepID=A0A182XSW0_ANOQN